MSAEPRVAGPGQATVPHRKLEAGDRMPDFVLPIGPRLARSFHDCFTGPPAVLLLSNPETRPQVSSMLESLGHAAAELRKHAPTLLVIERGPVQDAPKGSTDAVWFFDPEGQVSAALREAGKEAVLLLDREQRILARQESLADCVAWAVDLLQREVLDLSHQTTGFQAPVLTLRDVLEPALCHRLIDDWARDHREGGVRQAKDGAGAILDAAEADVDHGVKKRLDHYPGPEMTQLLGQRVQDRIGPELWRAFRYRSPYLERFIVGSYQAGRGDYFRPHRDNTTPGTRHRAFALTLNLNDDYEGGGLRFPEYGGALYVTPPGGAVVFSCSLLHEAVPVTRGTRYVALSFLVDPQAAQQRRRASGG